MNTIGLSRPAWSVRGSKKFILYFSWKPMIIPFWNQWLPMIHWQWNWIFSNLYFRLTRVLSGRKLSPVITNHNSTSYNRWVLTVQNCLSSNVWLYPSITMLKCVKRLIEKIFRPPSSRKPPVFDIAEIKNFAEKINLWENW